LPDLSERSGPAGLLSAVDAHYYLLLPSIIPFPIFKRSQDLGQ
jgi:hypothetical protein